LILKFLERGRKGKFDLSKGYLIRSFENLVIDPIKEMKDD